MIETTRRIWNMALAHRKWRWEKFRQSTPYTCQAWILTEERRKDPELRALYSQAGQDVLNRLDKAFKAFFKGIARYPRFKPTSGVGSFTYPQAYNGSVKIEDGTLNLSKVGRVPVVLHRQPPDYGLKTCTVRREPDGSWYASLVYDDGKEPPKPIERSVSPIGIDLGLKSIITTTDGQKVEPPRYLRKAEKRLKRLQRSLSRKQKGSKNREKARHLLGVQHAKVARQRLDFNQKLTTGLLENHDLVAMEDLQVKNMLRNHALAKSITDAGWGQIGLQLQYKTVRDGKLLVRVPPEYSTQDCHICRTRNEIGLDVRAFACKGCGEWLDRDTNGASNVLARALREVGQGMPELKPFQERASIPQANLGLSLPDAVGTIEGGVNVL
jgi:putative transposase